MDTNCKTPVLVHVVVEMMQENNSDKQLKGVTVFSDRDVALEYLQKCYERRRLDRAAYASAGPTWYYVTDKDGNLKEGVLLEDMPVMAPGTPIAEPDSPSCKAGRETPEKGDGNEHRN